MCLVIGNPTALFFISAIKLKADADERANQEGGGLILKGMVHTVCTSASITIKGTTLKHKAVSLMYFKPSSQSGGSSAEETEIDVEYDASQLVRIILTFSEALSLDVTLRY